MQITEEMVSVGANALIKAEKLDTRDWLMKSYKMSRDEADNMIRSTLKGKDTPAYRDLARAVLEAVVGDGKMCE